MCQGNMDGPLARSVFLQIVPGSGLTSRSDAVSSVVSVLLLVPGAAFLFLLVDLGRYLRGLRPPAPRVVRATSSAARKVAQSLPPSRFWSRLFHAAPSARS